MKVFSKIILIATFAWMGQAQARSTQVLSVTYGFTELKSSSSVNDLIVATKRLRETLLPLQCLVNFQQFFLQNGPSENKFLSVQGSLTCMFNKNVPATKAELDQLIKTVQEKSQKVGVAVEPMERDWRPGITVSN